MSVWLVGFIMYELHGITLNESEHFPIYRCPIRSGWKKISKRVCWAVIQSVCTLKVLDGKESAITDVKRFSFAVMSRTARTI